VTVLNCVHLLDDFSFGGVTKALSAFEDSRIRSVASTRVEAVNPTSRIAPNFDADVIITHFPPRWNALPFLISLRARNPRAHLIHIEHSYTGSWAALKVARPLRFRAMLSIAMRLFDQVICVSEGQGQWLRGMTGLGSNIKVIYPWAGDRGLRQVSPLHAPHSGPIRLGTYGRFAEQKGYDILIDAVRMLDPSRFTLTIGGDGPDDAVLRAAADGADNIRFVGLVDDLPSFYEDIDVYVIPSRWEAFGQIATEARLAGRPMLVSDCDGLPEQAEQGGIVADCRTAESLARAVEDLRSKLLHRIGADGRRSVVMAGEERINNWCALFTNIAAQRSASSSVARRAAMPIRQSAGQ
jgi:glycosyltransferase involved in cell wall biosynthesis